jgi:hypothetical protein
LIRKTLKSLYIYCKEFYKKAKFGLVKDESKYTNMEKITEKIIASENDGDSSGYKIVYDATKDVPVTQVGSYTIKK